MVKTHHHRVALMKQLALESLSVLTESGRHHDSLYTGWELADQEINILCKMRDKQESEREYECQQQCGIQADILLA